MTVTKVRVYKIQGKNKLRAIASITLDDVFMVHGIKVIEGNKGLFVAMPAEKEKRYFSRHSPPHNGRDENANYYGGIRKI